MKYPDYKYIEVAIGGVNKRNNVVEIGEFKIPEGKADCYRTVFRFPNAFKEHVANMGTVAGYKGYHCADFFPIDIDAGDLKQAHENAREIINRLAANYDLDLNVLRCFFSGAKGFHILIPEAVIDTKPDPGLSSVFKKMAREILSYIQYDPSIYDTTRLFRLANTINSKTDLYKIPLEVAEILHKSTEEILELAKKPRKIEMANDLEVNQILHATYLEYCKEDQAPAPPVDESETKPPRDAKLCYYGLLEGVGEGERDNAALRLAVYFRKQGYFQDMVGGLLQAWNRRNDPPLKDDDIKKAVRQAFEKQYDFGCNDYLLREYCDRKCHLKKRQKERVTPENIYSIDEARQKYLDYINQLEKRKITLGFPFIDREMRGIAPGEVCEILARSGVGKTAAVLNITKQQSEIGIKVLFFSLEQPLAQIYERTAQIAGGASGMEVERAFKRDESRASELSLVVSEKYRNLYVIDEDYLTYEELRDFIDLAPLKIGEKPGLVIIDYLGRMKGGRGTTYEVTSELAKLLKRLAKDTDTALVYIHQTNRAGKTGAEPVTMDMARDSGVVEEAADFVIGMWRPDIDKKEAQASETEEIRIALLKNRKGSMCQVGLCFHKPTLRIMEWDKTPDIENMFNGEMIP